jgi:hypothetical protein
MRKRQDIDAALKAFADKTRQLKERRVRLLGELVIATGADALTDAELAGALAEIAATAGAPATNTAEHPGSRHHTRR